MLSPYLFFLFLVASGQEVAFEKDILPHVDRCLARSSHSALSYFLMDGEWHFYMNGRVGKVGYKGSAGYGTPVYQSGDHLIVHAQGSAPQALIFYGDRLVKAIPLAGQYFFYEWRHDSLYVGGFIAPTQFQVSKLDKGGKTTGALNIEVAKKQSLYSRGRLFAVMHNRNLVIWVPMSQEIIELDLELNLQNRSTIEGLPDEVTGFDGLLMADIIKFKEAGNHQSETLKAYCNSNRGALLRVEPMRLVIKDHHLAAIYQCIVLHGYLDIQDPDPDALNEIDGAFLNLVLPLQGQDVVGIQEIPGGQALGLFLDDRYLVAHRQAATRVKYEVIP